MSPSKLSTPTKKSDITGYRLVDMEILSTIVSTLSCPFCKQATIKLSENNSRKMGLASSLKVKCTSCDEYCEEFYTSSVKKKSFDVNVRAAYSMRSCGQGFVGLQRFTALMNLPKPVTKNNYDKIIKRIHKATKDVAEQTMEEACQEIRGDAGPEEIINTPVSGDGTWQRRGHSSLNGVMTVISMDTGKILDVETMCRSCKSCKTNQKLEKEDPEAFEEWKSNHTCRLNYMGSANNMEPEGSKRIWKQSIEKNKLRYTELYSDGDSKSFISIRDTYGDDYKVKKLECVGHVQKRVGCRLRNLKKRGKGIGGRGKLTDAFIDKLQNYFGIAIRQNKNNLKGMRDSVRASLFHCASSKDQNLHFPNCPEGKDSWCAHNRDKANGTNFYKPGVGLPMEIVMKIRPIFDDLSKDELLLKCLHGKTQNQNESFNAMIWDRVPKTRYVARLQLELGVYDAVANFNVGRKASVLIYEQLNIIPGRYTTLGLHIINKKRLYISKYDASSPTKKRRKMRRGIAKQKKDKK